MEQAPNNHKNFDYANFEAELNKPSAKHKPAPNLAKENIAEASA